MDGDIKRHESNPKTRSKQKSSTLSRKAVAPKHKDSSPLGRPVSSSRNTLAERTNPFTPPKRVNRGLRIRHMLGFGVLALLLFGASMFFLGVSFGGDEIIASDEKTSARTPGDVPLCEVLWDPSSPVTEPSFTLRFDRELSIGFKPLFIANQQIVRAVDGVYKLDATSPTEYNVVVMQDSDVVTKDILCEYGPVLVGIGSSTNIAP